MPTSGDEERVKPPLPLFVSTERVLAFKFALIKSTLPSPFTSAVATDWGPIPTTGDEESVKPPLPLFVSTESVLAR